MFDTDLSALDAAATLSEVAAARDGGPPGQTRPDNLAPLTRLHVPICLICG